MCPPEASPRPHGRRDLFGRESDAPERFQLVAAAALGSDERLGQIEPGYVGDVIAVEADSLGEAISSADTQHLQLVVQAGVPISGPRAT